MALTHPVFTLDLPNTNPQHVTDAMWWMWLRLHELEPKSLNGGIYGEFKSGFHTSGKINTQKYPGNYSIKDPPNRTGPWWWEFGAAQDWTFPDAQRGDFRTINRYTRRLMASAKDPNDPRLDLILFEFYGNDDTDRQVEGYNEYREELATSDATHLWHIHLSYLRKAVGDFWAMWALLTVLMGWSVQKWKLSLGGEMGVSRLAKVTGPGEKEEHFYKGDGIWYTDIMTWDEHEYEQDVNKAEEREFRFDQDWKGWVGRGYASGTLTTGGGVEVAISQEQLNTAISANVDKLATALSTHFKVV